jgi:signal transduction histidine kinase/CheY-like chemotaxis protein
MKFYKPIRLLTKLIPYPDIDRSQSLAEWKSRLLFVVLAGSVVLGLLAYIPSIYFSLRDGLWMVVLLDTLVYMAVLYIAFSKKLSSGVKVNAMLVIFYILGIALLLTLGPMGAGFNWLYVFPLLFVFFYGYRGVILATVINIVSLALLTLPVYYNLGLISEYGLTAWVINSINFIVVTTFVALTLSVIIASADKSIKKEERMIKLLRKSQDELEVEKNRAEESDRLKSAFLVNMSHEIRTPMNTILGFSNLLTQPNLPSEKSHYYSSLVQSAGEQLVGIINDIIDISKIEINQMHFSIGQVPLYFCLLEIAEIFRDKIAFQKKNIQLKIEVDKKLQGLVLETDEIRFRQIAGNLMGNAVKYTDSGTISIGYTLKKENEGSFVEFFVQDTGRGIPKKDFNLIFERFVQGGNVGYNEGTGLGLSITKGLLSLLGGRIWFHSKLNKGSTFYFTLPYSEIKNVPVIQSEKLREPASYDYSGKLIYIAEDDDFSFYLLEEILTPTKISIKHAKNGKELMQLIGEKIPDLILLDIRMPEMDGLEALAKIRELYPDLSVIVQSANARREEWQNYLDHGCNDYISKPIDEQMLFKIIDPWLKKEKLH